MRELHPIQLQEIVVSRLSIIVNDPDVAHDYEDEIDITLHRGVSDFERDNPMFAVGLRATVKPKDDVVSNKPAFVIEVELSGQFTVDYSKFNFDDLERWSSINAPLIILPYLREQIYGLALRAGVRRIIMPLVVSQPAKPAKIQ